MAKTLKNKINGLWFAAVVTGAGGLATLLPYPASSEISILGYKALCPFAPISTAILFYATLMIRGHITRQTESK